MTEQRSPAQLVAASPAAAAGVPSDGAIYAAVSRRENPELYAQVMQEVAAAAAGVPTLKAREHLSTINERLAVLVNMGSLEARPGHEYLNRELVMREVCRIRDAAFALFKAASPVAPAGAPTEEREAFEAALGEPLKLDQGQFSLSRAYGGDSPYTFLATQWAWRAWQARALLSAQGCELATAATKQLREHSVHLAATPIDQDFRRLPASSEAAPSAASPDISPRTPDIARTNSGHKPGCGDEECPRGASRD